MNDRHYVFDSDKPVSVGGIDRLGFRPTAEKLASAILKHIPHQGWVLGIEGKWGSGKSTLVSFVLERLCAADNAPEIIFFSPWLISSRSSLLERLLAQVEAAAIKVGPNLEALPTPNFLMRGTLWLCDFIGPQVRDAWIRRQQLRLYRFQIVDRFSGYGNALKRTAALGPIVDAMGAGGAGAAYSVGAAKIADALVTQGSSDLSLRKGEVAGVLDTLARKIVVCIDDLDRLDPSEVAEVLRIVRVVADFPNVTYLLSYEPDVVAHSLEVALRVASGRAHLGKFVQATFTMPLPTSLDLQRWLTQESMQLFSAELAHLEEATRRDITTRLAEGIRVQGGRYLETPRDVVRTLNAIRLYGSSVMDLVDPADFVWLQLVRLGNSALHAWIERYLNEIARLLDSPALVVTEAGRSMALATLSKIFEKEGTDVDRSIERLSEVLPGMRGTHHEKGRTWALYENISQESLAEYLLSRRLGSSQHYRLYFALSAPVGSVDNASTRRFLNMCSVNLVEARSMFLQHARQSRPQGGSMAEPLLAHILANVEILPPESIRGVLLAVADGADEAARTEGEAQLGSFQVWNLADKVFETLIKRLSSTEKMAVLEELFRDGQALGWLVDIARDQIFEHGLAGERAKPEEYRLLRGQEFFTLLRSMLARLKETDIEVLLATPKPLSVLYGWKQGGGEKELSAAIGTKIVSDEGFMDVLAQLQSKSTITAKSAESVSHPLTQLNVKNFLEPRVVEERLNRIATMSNDTNRARAIELLEAIKIGKANPM